MGKVDVEAEGAFLKKEGRGGGFRLLFINKERIYTGGSPTGFSVNEEVSGWHVFE